MTDDLVKMARLAQRDDRMATGALYGDLADRIEELEAKLAKAVGLLGEADKRIIWEAIGFGNDFADRVDTFLAKHGATNDQG